MKREHLLAHLRVAGYHEDRAAFTRLYIENKISKAKADEAFRQGRAMKAAGVGCDCHDCKAARGGAAR